MGLRAAVFEQEQRLASRGGKRSISDLRKEQRDRESDERPRGDGSDLKSGNSSSSNPGVLERRRHDEDATSSGSPDAARMAALRAKALLYDRLKAGESAGVATQSVASLATLVDFSAKPRIESITAGDSQAPHSHPIDGNQSAEHTHARGPSATHPAKTTAEYTYQWSRGETHTQVGSDTTVADEAQEDGSRSSYSRIGDDTMDVATWKRHRAAERSFQSLIASAVQTEVEQSSVATKQLREVSQAARVKSQWEKTLSGASRDLLEQIHEQTEREKRAKEIGSSPSGANPQGVFQCDVCSLYP